MGVTFATSPMGADHTAGWIVNTNLSAMGGSLDPLKAEHDFNLAAGFNKTDDRLPEFMKEEKFPPHNVTFTVPDQELDRMWSDLK
jgi:hypothetical protein